MGSLHEGGTVGAMLITAIKRFADRPAIADNQTRWTYRELGQAAGRVVALFRTLGLKKGDGVALLATNRVETWAVVTAAAVMGLRYTSLHPLAAEDDHAFIVDDAEVDALVVGTISWMSWSDVRSISRWRGSHRRRRPLAFSMPPFCHEA